MKFTKYLARSGTIFCPQRRKAISPLWWWLVVAAFWVAMMTFVASEKLTACAVQFWIGGQ